MVLAVNKEAGQSQGPTQLWMVSVMSKNYPWVLLSPQSETGSVAYMTALPMEEACPIYHIQCIFCKVEATFEAFVLPGGAPPFALSFLSMVFIFSSFSSVRASSQSTSSSSGSHICSSINARCFCRGLKSQRLHPPPGPTPSFPWSSLQVPVEPGL